MHIAPQVPRRQNLLAGLLVSALAVATVVTGAAPAYAGDAPRPKLAVTGIVAAAQPRLHAAEAAPPATPYPTTFVEGFNDGAWYQRFGLLRTPVNTTVVPDGTTNKVLRVSFPQGSHDGTSFMFRTGVADDVHLSYRIRLSPNWNPTLAANNIKMPGFGSPVLAANGTCLVGCGGSPADGVLGYSARGQFSSAGKPGWYVYDADMADTVPAYGTGIGWYQSAYTPGSWYTVDLYIHMNTPTVHNGGLTAFVNGIKVFDRQNFNFRLVPGLHAGNAWFDFYYGGGGVAPANMYVDIDNVVVQY